MTRLRSLAYVLLLGAALAPAALSAAQDAQVLAVSGKAQFRAPGAGDWKPLKLGQSLREGSSVRTAETGKARLKTPDGTLLSLGPNTEISVAAMAPNAQKRSAFKFLHGALRALFSGFQQNKLDIFTQNAVVAVKGTDLETESGSGDAIGVKVFSSDHEGVLLSAWKGGDERLIRPGEAGLLDKSGLSSRALTMDDVMGANSFGGLPQLKEIPTPPPAPPATVDRKARLQQAADAVLTDKKAAAAIVKKALETGMSGALLERVLSEASQGQAQGGSFSQIAKDQGLDTGMSDILKDVVPVTGPSGAGATPAPTPAPTQAPAPQPTPAPVSGQNSLLQDANQALGGLQQDLIRDSNQGSQLKKSDLLAGNTFIDRQGYRVVLAQAVQRPDPASVQVFQYSQRSDGPFDGKSVFSHAVTYNQALPDDWTTVYYRALNDPINLSGGSPNYYRVSDAVSFASPGGDCSLCMSHTYSAPLFTAGSYKQAHTDYFQLNGVNAGSASYDATGAYLSGDIISISTPVQTADKAWQVTYDDLTTGQSLFTATVWLLDNSGTLSDPSSFGLNLDHFGGFGPSPSDHVYEVQLSSPSFNGKSVDLLVPTVDLEQALP
jgi:hypothetical protein